MNTRRQEKISSMLKDTVSLIFLKQQGQFIEKGGMISVTQVRISPDLSIARIYLSVFNVENKEAIIQRINAHKPELRKQTGQALRHSFRKIPDLEFYLDNTIEEMEKVNSLIEKLNKKDRK